MRRLRLRDMSASSSVTETTGPRNRSTRKRPARGRFFETGPRGNGRRAAGFFIYSVTEYRHSPTQPPSDGSSRAPSPQRVLLPATSPRSPSGPRLEQDGLPPPLRILHLPSLSPTARSKFMRTGTPERQVGWDVFTRLSPFTGQSEHDCLSSTAAGGPAACG